MEYIENTSIIVVTVEEEIKIVNDMNYVIKKFEWCQY